MGRNTPDTVRTSRARAFCSGVDATPQPSRYSRSTPFFPLDGWDGWSGWERGIDGREGWMSEMGIVGERKVD